MTTPPKPPATEAAIDNAREAVAQALFKLGRAQSAAILSAAKAKADQEALAIAVAAKEQAEATFQDLVNRFLARPGQEEALEAIRARLAPAADPVPSAPAAAADAGAGGLASGGQVKAAGPFLVGERPGETVVPKPTTIAHKVEPPAKVPVYTYVGRHSPLFPQEGETWLDESWRPPLPKKRVGKQWVSMEKDVTVGVDMSAPGGDLQVAAKVVDGEIFDVMATVAPLGPHGPKLEILTGRPEIREGSPGDREPMDWPASIEPPPSARTREGDGWYDMTLARRRVFKDGAWVDDAPLSYWPGGDAKEA